MKALQRLWFLPVLLAAALPAGEAVAQQGAPPAAAPASAPATSEKLFNNEQLDQMMAPVALYPDSLLAQLFMACTYPSSVAEAAAWSAAHKDEKGEAAVKMVEGENWDPAVKALVAFPQVLVQLKDQPDWVQKLGDAFLAQPKDVMDSVQRLRAQAQKAGNLESNEQQKVVVQQEPTTHQTVIEIQPTNPEVVYVPSYNPTVVYGTWAYPSYPPPYWPPPAYYYPMGGALATGIMFGAGMAIAGNLWGNCNWGGGDININTNRNTNINTGNRNNIGSGNVGSGNQKWSHNADNRRGTPYADKGSQQKFGQQDRAGANNRQDSRGRDSGAGSRDAGAGNRGNASAGTRDAGGAGAGNRGGASAGSRDAARQASADSFNRASSQGAGNRQGGAGGDRSGGAGGGNRSGSSAGGGNRGGGSAGSGSRSSGSNAFSGASSGGGASQRSSSRGNSSMNSRSGGSSAGRSASRSAPSRGGGGGGGRRR